MRMISSLSFSCRANLYVSSRESPSELPNSVSFMMGALCSSFGCSAVTRCYDRTDDNANAPINHATERSRMQRVVRNLLLDPMCEENSSVWEKSSTGTITRDQSTRQFGLVSYRLTIWSSDCVYVRQAVTLTPGKSYTLSGYVRSGRPARCDARCVHGW